MIIQISSDLELSWSVVHLALCWESIYIFVLKERIYFRSGRADEGRRWAGKFSRRFRRVIILYGIFCGSCELTEFFLLVESF